MLGKFALDAPLVELEMLLTVARRLCKWRMFNTDLRRSVTSYEQTIKIRLPIGALKVKWHSNLTYPQFRLHSMLVLCMRIFATKTRIIIGKTTIEWTIYAGKFRDSRV